MREIRTSGSEGGGTEPNRPSLPLSRRFAQCTGASPAPVRKLPLTGCRNDTAVAEHQNRER